MTQDRPQAGGVDVRHSRQIDNRVPDVGLPNRILKIEERLQCQRTLNAKNRCLAPRSRRADDLDVFHVFRFYYEHITIA